MRSAPRRTSLVLGASAVFAALVVPTLSASRAPIQQTAGGNRLALVIGNDTYPKSPLRNARNDARAVSGVLRELGFAVVTQTDADQAHLTKAVDDFVKRLSKGSVALVFYAGHGIQVGGENFLLPVDFKATDEADVPHTAYSASRLYDRMAESGADLPILILDACRDNPFRTSRSSSRGLAVMSSNRRTGGGVIAFSTRAG